MITVVETTVYTFEELSDSAKDKAREWWRMSLYGDNSFSNDVIYDAKQIGALMGIDIDKVHFSGFWSQGDGAQFTGRYRYAKNAPAKVKGYCNDERVFRIAEELQEVQRRNFYGLSAVVSSTGHYSHEYCTDISITRYVNEVETDYCKGEDTYDTLAYTLRDFMRWIYKQLEAAWEWEDSDECIDDILIVNEYTFTVDGERF